jgi:hypothetical protein
MYAMIIPPTTLNTSSEMPNMDLETDQCRTHRYDQDAETDLNYFLSSFRRGQVRRQGQRSARRLTAFCWQKRLSRML